jgi:hypothetical protein
MNYLESINRAERILGRSVTSSFDDLTNEFQLNIKSLVNQVNKDILLAFTYPCRERTTTLSVSAETAEKYSSVTNSITGEISCIYDTTDEITYTYNPEKTDFILGLANSYDYGFRNNKILFDANDTARTLSIEYYTNKLALDNTTYEDFVEGTTTQKDELTSSTDYSILPSFLHEPILVYGTCYYFELEKNQSVKMATFKMQFDNGVKQLNAHNRSEDQGYQFIMGNLDHSVKRSAV